MTAQVSQRFPFIPLWIVPLLALATSVNAQQQDSARISGTARSSVSGRPLPGVMIAVADSRVFGVSDSTGGFALSGLPTGKQTVRILYRDDLLTERPFTLKPGKTLQLEVLLDVEAVELAPIVVQARTVGSLRSLAGFYERRQRGFGRFYTFEDLERRGALPMRSLLLESGIDVRCRLGRCLPVIARGRACVPGVYLDGFPATSADLEFYRADDLAGLEIYKNAIEVPWDFRVGRGSSCGAVVMWTRY